MANASFLNLTTLDFDAYKQSLKDYLRSQTQFLDYDFEGSGMVQILNLLAYNTFYNGWYLNMVGNEMFLDTAQLRSSIVSHAKMLGYTPRSARGSLAEVTFTIGANDSPATVTIPAYTECSSVMADAAFTFHTVETVIIPRLTPTQTVYTATVPIIEGTHLVHRFVVNTANAIQRFVLPNANVDSTTLRVRVQASPTDTTLTPFEQATGVRAIGPNDAVFFVYETYDGFMELAFGDGVVGRGLVSNNIVIVDYLVTHGEEANKATGFTAPGGISGYTDVTVTLANTAAPSSGGQPAEREKSIKYLAPLIYQAQERCVTAQDYQAILQATVSGIESIAVWGGEDGDPNADDNTPIYGKVFISIKPVGGQFLSKFKKQEILNKIIKERMVMTMIPEIVDPDYVYLVLSSLVKYRSDRTAQTPGDLEQLVRNAIVQYSQDELEQFGSYFRFSRFSSAIDGVDVAITNSLTNIRLDKRFTPVLGVKNNYILNYGNPLHLPSAGSTLGVIQSQTKFSHANELGNVMTNCFLESSNTSMQIVRFDGTEKQVVRASIGTIDHARGRIVLVGFTPTAINTGLEIIVRAVPSSSDIIPKQNQLLAIDPANISITMFDDSQSLASTPATGLGGATGGFVVTLT